MEAEVKKNKVKICLLIIPKEDEDDADDDEKKTYRIEFEFGPELNLILLFMEEKYFSNQREKTTSIHFHTATFSSFLNVHQPTNKKKILPHSVPYIFIIFAQYLIQFKPSGHFLIFFLITISIQLNMYE